MSDPPDPSDTSTTSHLNTSIPRGRLDNDNLTDTSASEASVEAASSAAVANITLRRGLRARPVAPIPDDAQILHPAKPPQQPTPRNSPSPHRPSPQVSTRQVNPPAPSENEGMLYPPEVTSSPGSPRVKTRGGGGGGTRGGAHGVPEGQLGLPPLAGRRVDPNSSVAPDAPVPPPGKAKSTKGGARKVSAKREKFEALREEADVADSLSELATILGETIQTMDAHRATPTKECMSLLKLIQERLANHHELQATDDTQQSFTALLTRAVLTPVKELSTLVEAQQRAIQNLSKNWNR
ncbi:hypothetical protein B0H16DRAFT_1712800 [Mycena metata]|uniref:Uncharacterized protein n=1 Tax=Mycena metata TaxID=1033252 RepID=A0AAD7NVB9_9AGAR|nr:hypothetical protein B0H16DRAFT_1712800 [Mycena metata]